jgi:hypothetical protein
LSPASVGQASQGSAQSGTPNDWTHHHVIFSKPATAEQTRRVQQDPRYWQQIRRQSPVVPEVDTRRVLDSELRRRPHPPSPIKHPSKNPGLDRDWAVDLGGGASIGAGNYPAKYSFDTSTANCTTDFVVYPTGLTGVPGPTTGQASIVAYSNLYSGCGGIVPSVYWAYDTAEGTIQSSPVFSADGKQLAFVQADALGDASLVLLKWAASVSDSVTSPETLTPGRRGCIAPCIAEFSLTDALVPSSDTNSSVFYDYSSDTAYVGDDSGVLHQFHPVFKGTPAEVTAGAWPVEVNPTNPTPLASPVFDSGTGNVFVTDQGGFLYSVTSAGVVTASGQLDFSFDFDNAPGPGIVEGPVVDSTSGLAYVFATSDGSGGCSPSGADCSAVYQLASNFLAGDTGSEAVVGNSTVEPAVPSRMYIGAFDSTFQNSANSTGNLYVCGNTGGAATIFQVPIQAGIMGEVNTGPILSTSNTPCSPVTDVLNPNAAGGATEWIFASAQTSGVPTTCAAAGTGGCVTNFKDTAWLASTTYLAGQEILDTKLHIEVVKTGGTSGAIEPIWNGALGGATPDGTGPTTVTWLDQGPLSDATLLVWVASHRYSRGAEILDPNGNIELVTAVAGNDDSGSSIPTFNGTVGGTTTDGTAPNTVTWTNLGPIATNAMAASGGTSGVIIDNFVVGTGPQAGASQIYFTTLGNQTCTGGTGGCAVQASQSALQ